MHSFETFQDLKNPARNNFQENYNSNTLYEQNEDKADTERYNKIYEVCNLFIEINYQKRYLCKTK